MRFVDPNITPVESPKNLGEIKKLLYVQSLLKDFGKIQMAQLILTIVQIDGTGVASIYLKN